MLERNEESYLVTQNLSKSFGTFEAVRDVSISIKEGEFVCFLGPSGCGKTTLLRCIAGLEIQSTGSIIQKNNDISVLPPSSRDFGIVFLLMEIPSLINLSINFIGIDISFLILPPSIF